MFKKFAVIAALACAPIAASASPLPNYPFIHVTGTASLNVLPDIGEIDFEIVAADPDPAVARSIVETRIAEIRALLEEQGVPLDDLETRNVRQEVLEGEPGAVQLYEVRCAVHLNIRELGKWRDIVGPLLGAANLDGFSTAFGTLGRDKIEADLTAEAIRNARRRAEAIAAGFKRKLGRVTAVTSGSLKNLGASMGLVQADFMFRRDTQVAAKDRRDLLMPEILKFAQQVDVIYRIE